MLVFPNVGFMGYPVSEVILGPVQCFTLSCSTCRSISWYSRWESGYLPTRRLGKLDPRILLTPGLAASILGLFLFMIGYHIPYPADAALDWIGKATTPLAMLVVGALLATLPSAVWQVTGVCILYLH